MKKYFITKSNTNCAGSPKFRKYIQLKRSNPIKIVVLDGYTLNPGDLSWDDLKALGTCEIHDRTAVEEVVPRARNVEIVLTNKTVVNRQSIQLLAALRYIGVLATGYNIVDVQTARERNIPVTKKR